MTNIIILPICFLLSSNVPNQLVIENKIEFSTPITNESHLGGIVPFNFSIETVMPDWNLQPSGNMGSSTNNLLSTIRLATVIVETDDGWGSGAIVDSSGVIVTNYHVIEDVINNNGLKGEKPLVSIISCTVNGPRVKRKPGILKAEVIYADPIVDLAVLKTNSNLGAAHSFELSDAIDLGMRCFAVGSQGGGLAWAIKSGSISGVYSYPEDVTDSIVVGASTASKLIDRTNASILVTDCSIAPGDSGGPISDEQGKLIGLTFATPSNLTGGSTGYHICSDHILDVLNQAKQKVAFLPIDIWTGADSSHLFSLPSLLDIDSDRKIDAVAYHMARNSETGIEGYATLLVISDEDSFNEPRDATTIVLPKNLWGVSGGTFKFNRFVLLIKGGVILSGVCDAVGRLQNICIERAQDSYPTKEWKYERGAWQLKDIPKTAGQTRRYPIDGLSEPDIKRFMEIMKASKKINS